MSDVPFQVTEDLGLVQLPQSTVSEIYERAAELAKLEREIRKTEAHLQELKDDKNELARKVLPELFDQASTDRLGVPGWNADVVLEPTYHASIPKDWPEERRAAAFAELERLGGDDLLKVRVSVDFAKKEFELAADFVRHISQLNWMGGREVTVDKSVAWNTLTKFVRELRDRRVPANLTALGASIYRECKIVWRRDDR